MKKTLFSTGALMLALLSPSLSAQTGRSTFVPFKEFLHKAKTAFHDPTRPGSHVRDSAAFEEMRHHLLSMYEGIEPTHSFVLDSAHFDCVPAAKQPSLRILGLDGIADPPPASLLARPAIAAAPNRAAGVDEFGNSTACAADEIAMRRITLEDMTQYRTLRDFFAKSPDGSGEATDANQDGVPAASASDGHKYSYMMQTVNNLGGYSALNLWMPSVNTNIGETMSLSQQWYTGGSGASFQTAEVGWQVQPGHWHTQNPVLFVFWTADNYASKVCYNLDCGAFVQYPGTQALGAPLSYYSEIDGPQYEVSAQYYLYDNKWYVAIDGTWIGYYPVSIYKGGQMSKYAQHILYGSESAATKTMWPPEGSGQWAERGFQKAAYQRNVFYIDLSGNYTFPTLTPEQPSPKCYTTSGPFYSDSPDWGIYFFEGGPGC